MIHNKNDINNGQSSITPITAILASYKKKCPYTLWLLLWITPMLVLVGTPSFHKWSLMSVEMCCIWRWFKNNLRGSTKSIISSRAVHSIILLYQIKSALNSFFCWEFVFVIRNVKKKILITLLVRPLLIIEIYKSGSNEPKWT